MFTLPETNGFSHLKMDSFWNTFSFPLGDFAYFQVQTAVSFRECIPHGKYRWWPAPLPCMSWFDSSTELGSGAVAPSILSLTTV